MHHAEATIEIDAPIDLIWSVMLDLDRYAEWNPFILRVDRSPAGLPPRVGERITLRVRFGDRTVASPERVTAIEPPAGGRATLEYEFYGRLHRLGLVRGRRRQTLSPGPSLSTVYHTSETFHGPLAFVLPLRGVRSGFRRHAAALKHRAEQMQGHPTNASDR